MEAWNRIWHARGDCRQTKQWLPSINKLFSKEIILKNRKIYSMFVQLITGHNFLNRHESLVHPDKDPLCRLCLEEEETSFHVIAECPALCRQRWQVFGLPVSQTIPLKWTLNEVSSFLREASIADLLDPEGIE